MKWPENKQDQQKILALIGIGIAGLLYVLYAFVYQPLRTAIDTHAAEIVRLETETQTARTTLRQAQRATVTIATLQSELANYSDAYLLHPRLGNYLLTAREQLGQAATPLDLQTLRDQELGILRIPFDTPDPLVQAYGITVNALLSYTDLQTLINALYDANPVVSCSNLLITGQPENPLLHRVQFQLHWPIWVDPAMQTEFIEDSQTVQGAAS